MDINFDFFDESNEFERSVKTKIVIINTKYSLNDYINKISKLYLGKYNKIPSYLISKSGLTYQFYPDNVVHEYYQDKKINNQTIVVALENVGWLTYIVGQNKCIDWKGLTITDFITKEYLNKSFWDMYPET
jgi:hypothetical protein